MSEQTQLAGIGETLTDKTEKALELLSTFEQNALAADPVNGYHLGFSGGKDSVVIEELARLSGVKFRAVYNQPTIDPPELVRFIKTSHPDVFWDRPKRNFFKALAESHGLPTRMIRWCCAEFKEGGGKGCGKILGVRAAESVRRAKTWKQVTLWRSGGFVVNPILYWSDDDVWQFIREHKLPYCSLYDEGWTRLGCVGCPMSGEGRRAEFARWPGFEKAWRAAARKYFDMRKGKPNRFGEPYYIEIFKSGDEYFDWWMSNKPKEDESQMCLNLSSGNEKEVVE